MFKVLRYIYSFVITLALPVIFLRLLWRSLKVPAYRLRWAERLGIFNAANIKPHGIWLHAVSVGEVVAALPLIIALKAKYPDLNITVTTTTPTGSQRLRQSLGDTVTHVYLPYDLTWALQNFLRRIKPKCLIIMETELWPNLLYVCKQHKIPVLIANARLSNESFAGYLKFKNILTKMLQQVTYVAAQSPLDGERFLQLGLAANKLRISGNLKFDVATPLAQQQLGQALKASLADRLIWVVASTHSGEEEQILPVFIEVKQRYPQLLLILVPRHPDRFNEVAKLLEKNNLSYVRRSQNSQCDASTAVLLGDTMGELNIFYAAADLAFVAGSLLPIGGHNLLEPAALSVPTITGPHMTNFQEITHKLLQAAGVCQVQNPPELTAKILEWLELAAARHEVGSQGYAVVMQNRGATLKTMELVSLMLDQ